MTEPVNEVALLNQLRAVLHLAKELANCDGFDCSSEVLGTAEGYEIHHTVGKGALKRVNNMAFPAANAGQIFPGQVASQLLNPNHETHNSDFLSREAERKSRRRGMVR